METPSDQQKEGNGALVGIPWSLDCRACHLCSCRNGPGLEGELQIQIQPHGQE